MNFVIRKMRNICDMYPDAAITHMLEEVVIIIQ
jgi:hypothetical protein